MQSHVTQHHVPSAMYSVFLSAEPDATSNIEVVPASAFHLSDVYVGTGEVNVSLQSSDPVAQTQQSSVATSGRGEIYSHNRLTRHQRAHRASHIPDARSSFGLLMDSFDAFMEAWASYEASPVPYFFWSSMELCPYKAQVQPLRAAAILYQRSYTLDSPPKRSAASRMHMTSHGNSSYQHFEPSTASLCAEQYATVCGASCEAMTGTQSVQFGAADAVKVLH